MANNKLKDPEIISSIENAIVTWDKAVRFSTEAIRGMMVDLKKLADEIDPPAKRPSDRPGIEINPPKEAPKRP